MNFKKLILLTSEFPYGNGETFLESELPFLAKEFQEIIIVSNDVQSKVKRETPANCSVHRFDLNLKKPEKFRALWGLVDRAFKKEKKYLKDYLKLPINSGIRNTMLVSLYRAKKIKSNLIRLNGSRNFANVVCYSYWCDDNALGLALLNDQFPEVKTVSRAHGWDLYFEASELNYLPYRKFISQHLDKLFPISQKGFEYIVERWGGQRDKIIVNRLGSPKGKLLASGTSFKLISCSNLIPLKRVDLIASALSQIINKDIEWFHFGEGPEMSKLKTIIRSIPKNIEVHLMGRKSNREILKWYHENAPDLFVNVSTTEGIPVSIMEAMSFGTPVLATDVGGTSEIVDYKNGELLPGDLSAKLLSDRIVAFIETSKEEQLIKRKEAFETWNSTYNASRNYSEFARDLAAQN